MAAPVVTAPRRPAWHYWVAFLATIMLVGALLAVAYAVTGIGKFRPGFLGTNARFLADLNLVLQILMAVVLVIGFFFIRRGNWRAHKYNQTIVVLTNLVLIIFIMVNTLVTQVLPESNQVGERRVWIPMLHGIMGLVAEILGIYLILRMNDLIPSALRVKNFKRVMRVTLALWLLTAAVGVWVYTTLYGRTAPATVAAPAAPATASAPTTEPPTAAPNIAPTAEAPVEATAPAEVTAEGSALVRDNFGRGDQLSLSLQNVPALEAGRVYAGWLTGAEGFLIYPVGQIPVTADGTAQLTFDAPNGENLLAQFDGFVISREGETLPERPSELLAWGQVSLNAMEHIRHLMVSSPDTPGEKAIAYGLREQIEELERHALLIEEAVRENDFEGMRRHTEHVILLIEGPGGANYRDLDGDGEAQYPGDGFGLLAAGDQTGYVQAVADTARQATEAASAGDLVKLHGGHVQVATANVQTWLTELRDIGLTIYDAQDVAATGNKAQQMLALADRALNGFDANNNETVEPVPGEGGARVAYQHSQLMATFPLVIEAAAPAQAVVLAEAVVPTPLPAPTPTATVAPPAPSEVTVPMVNFVFEPPNVTVKVGTTIHFVNQDNAPHTATEDANLFDTGTIGAAETGSLTVEEAGTFRYYCVFHGGPGG
ncbi:MAG TPA: DUF420 domain-containing protein, partial [Ardenticatenaceae bacterium]|nr:DUF420 domain-containing protein [Ardenticatenaceae bacterium]